MLLSTGSFAIAAVRCLGVVFGISVSVHQMSVTWKKYCFVLHFIHWDMCAEIAYDLVWSCPTSKSVIRSWYRAHEVWLKIFHAYSCHYLGWQSCWRREPVSSMGRLRSGTVWSMNHTCSPLLYISHLCIKIGPQILVTINWALSNYYLKKPYPTKTHNVLCMCVCICIPACIQFLIFLSSVWASLSVGTIWTKWYVFLNKSERSQLSVQWQQQGCSKSSVTMRQ